METVNNIASAASKAIWGEPTTAQDGTNTDSATSTTAPKTKGTEPLSGEMGDTKKGEPYDKGNIDSTSTENTTTKLPSTSSNDLPAKTMEDTYIEPLANNSNNPSTSSFQTTPEKPLISERINPNIPSTTDSTANKELNPSTSTTLPIRSEHDTEKTGVTDMHKPTLGTQSKNIKPSESSDTGAPEGDNAVDVSGPGPRSLEEVAKENDGTAAGAGAGAGSSAGVDTSKPSSTANMQGVQTDLKPKENEYNKKEREQGQVEKGKENAEGEHYVKSTGLHAEGGDFDATKPGAGREADRLLGKDGGSKKEEKDGTGVDNGAVTSSGSGESGSGNARKSTSSDDVEGEGKKEGKLSHLKEKIKEKLHKH